MKKTFKTISEQIKILKKRNLIIDENLAENILKNNNYYYLINGYKDLFVNIVDGNEKYKDNVTIEEIYSLYNFNSNLRINFLKYILKIERKIDTYIAYEFSKQYGHKNYLNVINFDSNKFTNLKISNFISEIYSNIDSQLKLGNKMLNHYINNHGYIPLWVLVRILSFGQISKFYHLMKQKDQNAIAKNFNIKEKILKTFIYNLAIIRNVCAHDEKLYDIQVRKVISQNYIHEQLCLNLKNNKYCMGYKDLFSIVIILKILLNSEDFKDFYSNILSDIDKLKKSIHSVNFSLILNKMGFPENYKDLLNM